LGDEGRGWVGRGEEGMVGRGRGGEEEVGKEGGIRVIGFRGVRCHCIPN